MRRSEARTVALKRRSYRSFFGRVPGPEQKFPAIEPNFDAVAGVAHLLLMFGSKETPAR